MAEGSSKKGMIGFGIFLVAGAVLTSAARLAGLKPPSSDTAYSHGSDAGYWIGTAIGILVGIVLIVRGFTANDDGNKDKDS